MATGPQPACDLPAAAPAAEENVRAALLLLDALRQRGLAHLVVCPGSRSAPLAAAAAVLEPRGLALYTAIDERSAAFFALGVARASGRPAAVVTTSGSAVAHLLPAAVEADHGTIPLLLLTADRPLRLKGCGANQSVNQEEFLAASCRWLGPGDPRGLACMGEAELDRLAHRAVAAALGDRPGVPAGPVHLNLPFEEPLHIQGPALRTLADAWRQRSAAAHPPSGPSPALLPPSFPTPGGRPPAATVRLDPDRPGVTVAGPWRGRASDWPAHVEALRRWQRRSGWPLLADALSGLRGQPDLPLVAGYDLLLEDPSPALAAPQVLRLGPLPASRNLQRWLTACAGRQVLVSEGEGRPLDPLGVVGGQWAEGLPAWLAAQDGEAAGAPAAASLALAAAWHGADHRLQAWLEAALAAEAGRGAAGPFAGHPALEPDGGGWSEPALARRLGQLLPPGWPLMLANSSPVRDWESFGDPAAPARPVFSFRGASGIDGTLSIACGLAQSLGRLVLVTGDLALLHDANGWLWRTQLRGRLTVVLIQNDGGGIFEQLPIRTDPVPDLDFERLFAMPQPVDALALAAVHGVPSRRVAAPATLADDLAWALGQPMALLEVRTDRRADAVLRRRLRTMAAGSTAPA